MRAGVQHAVLGAALVGAVVYAAWPDSRSRSSTAGTTTTTTTAAAQARIVLPEPESFGWEGASLPDPTDDEKKLKAECAWLVEEAKKPGAPRSDFVEHLERLAASRGDEGKRCLTLLREGMRAYGENLLRSEAKAILGVLASAIRSADAACLAKAPPVPSTLEAFGASAMYSSTAAEWKTPAWECLAFRKEEPQRYRYSVDVDQAKTKFVAIAERGDGAEVLFVRGAVRGTGELPVLRRK
jgi:hypothetical protein